MGKRRNRTGFGRVTFVEVGYEFRGVSEVSGWFIGDFVGLVFVTFPTDDVDEASIAKSTVRLGVEDLGDLIFGFAVNFNRRRGVRSSLWKRILSMGF